jgi:hypothetical protein
MKIESKDFRVPPDQQVDLGARPTSVDPVANSRKQYRKLLADHVAELSSLQCLHYASD